jgi:DNA uptake protein ComE-like DNA-binding protein
VKSASAEELAAVPGIDAKLASTLKEHLGAS